MCLTATSAMYWAVAQDTTYSDSASSHCQHTTASANTVTDVLTLSQNLYADLIFCFSFCTVSRLVARSDTKVELPCALEAVSRFNCAFATRLALPVINHLQWPQLLISFVFRVIADPYLRLLKNSIFCSECSRSQNFEFFLCFKTLTALVTLM